MIASIAFDSGVHIVVVVTSTQPARRARTLAEASLLCAQRACVNGRAERVAAARRLGPRSNDVARADLAHVAGDQRVYGPVGLSAGLGV